MFTIVRIIIAISSLPLLFVLMFPWTGYMWIRTKLGDTQMIARSERYGEEIKRYYAMFIHWNLKASH